MSSTINQTLPADSTFGVASEVRNNFVAAATDIEALQGGVVSVATYNADPTGVASSTAAFQSAIDAVAAAGGGVVYIPVGTYSVGALWASDEINFRGEGLSNTNLVSNGTHAEYGFLWFDSGSEEPVADDVVVGATSGATGTVLALDSESGTVGGGNQTGRLYLKDITGTFARNENLNIQGGTSNVMTTASVWQSAIFNIWGSGGTTPSFDATSTGGSISDLYLSGVNSAGSGVLSNLPSNRMSSYLKKVTVQNGNGTTPSASTHFAFTSGTSNYRGHVWLATSIAGDWGAGTGTATLWLDFVESTTGVAGSITIDSDAAYPGPEAALTVSETLSFYDDEVVGITATCDVLLQTDADTRDISGIDYSAQAFARLATVNDVRISGLHNGIRTAQNERSLRVVASRIEACTFAVYVLQNHPVINDVETSNCVVGLSGQNLFDLDTPVIRGEGNLYGIVAYSERPGIGIANGRHTLSGVLIFGRYYCAVLGDRCSVTGCTFYSDPLRRADLIVSGDSGAVQAAGPVNGNYFGAEGEDHQPAIAHLWIKGLAELPVVGNTFEVFRGGRGILYRNPLAPNYSGVIANNYFSLRGGNAIVFDSNSTATGGSATAHFIFIAVTGNNIYSRSAPATQFYSVAFSAMQGELPTAGATVTGATSTSTATMEYVHYWRAGTLGANDVRGVMVLSAPSGNFTVAGENITYGATGQATLSANPYAGATSNLVDGEPAFIINGAQFGNLIADNMVYDLTGDISYGFALPDIGSIRGNFLQDCSFCSIDDSTIRTTYTNNLIQGV